MRICVEYLLLRNECNLLIYFRVKGRNVQESEFIKMGGYHTLDLEPNRKFTLYKNEWDSVSIERIENACDPTKVRFVQ